MSKEKHSPTPWSRCYTRILDADNLTVCVCWRDSLRGLDDDDETAKADAALIVEAVNAIDATLKLQRTLLGWSIERDRLRDIVRRLANMAETTIPDAMENWDGSTSGRVEFEREAYALIREARAAIGEAGGDGGR